MVVPRATAAPIDDFLTCRADAFGQPVRRLGLASRGASSMTPDDVHHAIDRGVNFLNWPGFADTPGGPDALSQAIAGLGSRRKSVVVSVQFGAGRSTTPGTSSGMSWRRSAPTTWTS